MIPPPIRRAGVPVRRPSLPPGSAGGRRPLLLRLSPTVLVLAAVELALVAAAGVLAVHPPPPEPVARDVVVLCRRTDVTCPQIIDQIRADMQELDR